MTEWILCPNCHMPSPKPIEPDLELALRQTLEEFYNAESFRNSMYSEGYNSALRHITEYLDGRSWEKS